MNIQNESLSGDVHYNIANATIGSQVTSSVPPGQVIVKDGAKILISKDGDILIKESFSVEKGGVFEINNK